MRVPLTKKLSTVIDGVDLSAHEAGDVFDLTWLEARLLLAEGWAVRQREVRALADRRQYGASASHPNASLRAGAANRQDSPKLAKRRLR